MFIKIKIYVYLFIFSLVFSCADFTGTQKYSAQTTDSEILIKDLFKFLIEGLIIAEKAEPNHAYNYDLFNCDNDNGYFSKEHIDNYKIKLKFHNCEYSKKYYTQNTTQDLSFKKVKLNGYITYVVNNENYNPEDTKLDLNNIKGNLTFVLFMPFETSIISNNTNTPYNCDIDIETFNIEWNNLDSGNEENYINNIDQINEPYYYNSNICGIFTQY